MPMAFRIEGFGNFLRLCMKDKDLRIEQFVEMQDGDVTSINEELVEAAATVKIGDCGFSRDELFAKAIHTPGLDAVGLGRIKLKFEDHIGSGLDNSKHNLTSVSRLNQQYSRN